MAAATASAFLDTSIATARVSSSLRLARVASRVASFDWCTRRRSPHVVVCSGGGCCGGSGSGSGSSSSSSCSSHGKDSLTNLGKEFEHLVATNTLLEFEKEYNSAPMEGKITRDIINTVMDTNPDESATNGERCLDINEILADAKSMSNGDLIFSEDPEFVLV